jgi:hypothetical protein
MVEEKKCIFYAIFPKKILIYSIKFSMLNIFKTPYVRKKITIPYILFMKKRCILSNLNESSFEINKIKCFFFYFKFNSNYNLKKMIITVKM